MASADNTPVTPQGLRPADTIVHLGAGTCEELDAYLGRRPRNIWLVEADPTLAEQLRARVAGLSGVEMDCIAVAGCSGPRTLHRYNLPRSGSLHPATGLLSLFPGLREVEQLKVDAVRATHLLEALDLQPDAHNVMVVDLAGEERGVLQDLFDSQHLHRFRELRVHCGRDPLYQGSLSSEQLIAWLESIGFSVASEDGSRDPDFPCWSLRRNDLLLRNRELQTRLDELQPTIERLSRENADLVKQLRTVSAAHDDIAKRLQEHKQWNVALKAANEKLETHSKALTDKLETVSAAERQGAADRDTLRAQVVDLQKQWAAATTERAAAKQMKARYQQLEADNKNAKEQIAALKQTIADNQRQVSGWHTLVDQEMIKAEAQIALIRDVLIHDKSA